MSDELFTLLILLANHLWVGAVCYLIGKYKERVRSETIAKGDRIILDREISALKISMNKVWDHIKPVIVNNNECWWEDAIILAWNTKRVESSNHAADAETVRRERDAAIARAERAERLEQELRSEISAAFTMHGLAAGPRAVDAIVEERDTARAAHAEAMELLKSWKRKGIFAILDCNFANGSSVVTYTSRNTANEDLTRTVSA